MGDPGNPDMGEAGKTSPSKVMKVLANYWAVQQSPDNTPNKQQDVKIREEALGRLKVDDTWMKAQDKLSPLLEMADDPAQKARIPSLVDGIDFTKPVDDTVNQDALNKIRPKSERRGPTHTSAQSSQYEEGWQDSYKSWADLFNNISEDRPFNRRPINQTPPPTYEQSREEWRQELKSKSAEHDRIVKEKRDQERAEKERKEEQRRALLKVAKEKALALHCSKMTQIGATDGQRLANLIYDPEARKEITDFLNYVVSKRKGLFGNLSKVREKVIEDLMAKNLLTDEEMMKYKGIGHKNIHLFKETLENVRWALYYDDQEDVALQSG